MYKVAMIGAGSVVFSRNLTGDILSLPQFRDARFTYMDIDEERLDVAVRLCRKQAAALGATPTIEGTTDLDAALTGADFVINMVQIGGMASTLIDFEIPRAYGLKFTIADTTGPGGFFRALRTFPMLSGMARKMDRICPNAFLLNYSNPMSMNMQAVFRTSSVRAVGLCHSVQGTFEQLMRYIGEKPEEVEFTCAGINHMAFYLSMRKNGVDLYPRLFKAMEDPKHFRTNPSRFELMKRFGHFVTESSEHNAEYCAHFIPHGERQIAQFQVPIDEYLRRCDGIIDTFERLKTFSRGDEPMKEHCRSHEYCSTILDGITTGKPQVIYGNLPNGGTISNLPRTAIVEAPTLVDRTGLHHAQVGALPWQLIGYMQPHVVQHELFIEAAVNGRREAVYQACMMDPLTAATLTPDKIVEMCDAMIAAHADRLPQLDAPTLVPTSGKSFPKADIAALEASWRKRNEIDLNGVIRDWQVIGAFVGPDKAAISLDVETPVDADYRARGDGSVDLKKTYAGVRLLNEGGKGVPGAATVGWKPAKGDAKAIVKLHEEIGALEWCLGYGYAEVESIHARDTVLHCGSDDGIRIWLNGELVHDHEVGRGTTGPNQDQAVIRLQAGINRILVKNSQYVGGWGFAVRIAAPTH